MSDNAYSFLGMNECANYLQEVLVNNNANRSMKSPSSPSSKSLAPEQVTKRVDADGNTWQTYYDAQSGQVYLIHSGTGECLWETDYQARQVKQLAPVVAAASPPLAAAKTASPEVELWVITKACRARLVGLFSKVDPARLVEVDSLLAKYSGNELELMNEMATSYDLNADSEFKAFQRKLREMKGLPSEPIVTESPKSLTRTQSTGSMDPTIAQALVQETTSRYEAQIESMKTQFQSDISSKDREVSSLGAKIDTYMKEIQFLESERHNAHGKITNLQATGKTAMASLEADLKAAFSKNGELQAENQKLVQCLDMEQERLKSFEMSMSSLTAGHSERMEAEKRTADERLQHQMEREQKFARDLSEAAANSQREMEKLKQNFENVRKEMEFAAAESNENHEKFRKAKQQELESLRTETKNKIDSLIQEVASMKSDLADANKKSETQFARAEAAEALQKIMQNEIVEARQIQQFNSQLHKDLSREQAARKRLHNEMEDLKGRIRVYVRVRPFSKSEIERGSTEAVFKDGKLSVVVKAQDSQKKTFDFDQVFGGADSNGNSQTDVFRDTKHLIMSVVDGYNVCIFAYGQTGSGKTFTMIGAADIGECLHENGDFDELAGITPRAVSELFRLLNERHAQLTFVVGFIFLHQLIQRKLM